MESHRTIWKIAAACVTLALLALIGRELLAALKRDQIIQREAARERFHDVDEMLLMLRNDPRVRQPKTQQLVDLVARYAEDPGIASSESLYALGLKHYYGLRDFEGAEEAFRDAIERKPEWSWPYNNLGILLFDSRRHEEAMEAWETAMRLDPTWSRPRNDMAIQYRRYGRMDEAIVEIEKALEIDSDDPVTYYNYGVILDLLDRHDEARAKYEKAIELDATLPAAYYNLACGYAREGALQESMIKLEEAIRLNPHFRNEALWDSDFDAIRSAPLFEKAVAIDSPN